MIQLFVEEYIPCYIMFSMRTIGIKFRYLCFLALCKTMLILNWCWLAFAIKKGYRYAILQLYILYFSFFCSVISMAKSLKNCTPSKESIDALNQDIVDLYKKCKTVGYDDQKLKEIIYPVAHMAKCVKWKFCAKQLIYFSLIIGTIAGMIQWSVTNRIVSAACKKFMVYHVSCDVLFWKTKVISCLSYWIFFQR